MPVFALGFGSFGDILATIQLAVRIAIVVRQSGRSIEYTETEKELMSLNHDLDLAHRTLQKKLDSPLAPFVAERIRDEIVRCHKLMASFFAKISAPQGLWQKVRRAASQERGLAALQVIERRTALSLVLGIVNSGALMAVWDRIEAVGDQVVRAHGLIQDVHSGVSQQLADVDGQVRHGHKLIQDGMSGIIQQLANYLYHEQVVAVIKHVPTGVSEAMLFALSPTGISIPIPATYCDSFEVLDNIIRSYSRGWKDAFGRYVERGDYCVVGPADTGSMNLTAGMSCDLVILPGRRHDTKLPWPLLDKDLAKLRGHASPSYFDHFPLVPGCRDERGWLRVDCVIMLY
ncbi:hypothetical protein DFH09DRAFT_1159882, partial [Mycena vulgaris]